MNKNEAVGYVYMTFTELDKGDTYAEEDFINELKLPNGVLYNSDVVNAFESTCEKLGYDEDKRYKYTSKLYWSFDTYTEVEANEFYEMRVRGIRIPIQHPFYGRWIGYADIDEE